MTDGRTASGLRAEAPTRVVIDTDPGIDDAVAIALALASPEIDVVGVTAVAGNAPLRATTRNALRVLQIAGSPSVPVAAGADRPLLGLAERHAESVHGADGLFEVLEFEPAAAPLARHAVDFVTELAASDPISIVAIAPLTNLALLFALRPEVTSRIDRLFIMGGARLEGNVTPAAEFNVWFDPEAAARVFNSGISMTVLPLDVTHQAWLTGRELDALGSSGPLGKALAEMARRYAGAHRQWFTEAFCPLHDVLAVLALCMPDVMTYQEVIVDVETGRCPSRGATIMSSTVAREGEASARGRALVGTSLDRERFASVLVERIHALDASSQARSGSS